MFSQASFRNSVHRRGGGGVAVHAWSKAPLWGEGCASLVPGPLGGRGWVCLGNGGEHVWGGGYVQGMGTWDLVDAGWVLTPWTLELGYLPLVLTSSDGH